MAEKREINIQQEALRQGLIGMAKAAQKELNLTEVDVCAIFGSVVGEITACADDIFAHDEELISQMKLSAKKHNETPTMTPCYDTFMVNLKYAHETHIASHDKARAIMKEGDTMLQTVCDSHRKDK